MASDPAATTTGDEAFVSLYRRYRPGTFSALRGQDHVVRALRTAVRDDHVAHAYLFSGPRGTGKTSSARILAKALNCEALEDGEPCGVCSSCLEITRGSSMDVTELDAASNNGVDAMRDLIAHASLGSPGRHKVYIIDEVHMLSVSAANSLLKTLEEPPPHVVFVLATTDPQKVPATIRSRTQHLEFRLLNAETIEHLLRDVRDDAHLELDDEALNAAVRKGRGSARDALSALDQVAASGESGDLRPEFIEVIEGIGDEDASRTLVALSTLTGSGWGPEQLVGELVADLRQAFLLLMAPEIADVVGDERERLSSQADRIGLVRLVRAIELLGQAQVDMRSAADPTVVLEVAVVRAARADLGAGAGLDQRVIGLERRIAELEARPAGTPATSSTPPPEAPSDGSTASLGAWRSRHGGAPSQPAPAAKPTEAPASPPPPPATPPAPAAPEESSPLADLPVVEPAAVPEATPVASVPTDVTIDVIRSSWADKVLPGLSGRYKALFRTGELTDFDGSTLHIGVPNDQQLVQCQPGVPALEKALAAAFGSPVAVELVLTKGGHSAPAPKTAAPVVPELPDEEEIEAVGDVNDLEEAPQITSSTMAASKILKAFPGAIEEDS